ncbi:MAG: hypothetical protein AAB599_00605 [Patescibacteria group bacterium]
MDPVQILLFVTVTILTGLLVAVGVQVFLILRNVQKTIDRANKLLDDAHVLTNSVTRPIEGLRHFVEGVKDIGHLSDVKTLSGLVSHFVKKEEAFVETIQEEPSVEERARALIKEGVKHPIHRVQEQGRRFFHRAGKPLTS